MTRSDQDNLYRAGFWRGVIFGFGSGVTATICIAGAFGLIGWLL